MRVIRPVRRALAAAVTAAALLAVPVVVAPAQATPAPKCPSPTVDQAIARADVVFRGEVKKVQGVTGQGKQRTRTYRVPSDRVYQSSLVQPEVVVTDASAAAARCPKLPQAPATSSSSTRAAPR